MPDAVILSYCGETEDVILVNDGLGQYLCAEVLLSTPNVIKLPANYSVRTVSLDLGGRKVRALLMVRDGGTCRAACVLVQEPRLSLEGAVVVREDLLKAAQALLKAMRNG